MAMDRICFKINRVKHTIGSEVSSDLTLLDYLRGQLELRGTKYMCREAGCGACVVSARKPEGLPYAVNSCMMTVTSCHGLEFTTIEEVGNRQKGYHPLQTMLAKHNGTQCGHCTPGWIMSMYSLLLSKPDLTMLEIEQSLGSNICRCTGYRPIMESFKKFAKDSPEKCILDIEDLHICKKTGKNCDKSKCNENDWCIVEEEDVLDFSKIEIKLKDNKFWYRVQNIKDIFCILQEKGDDSYMLVAGNTAKGGYPIDDYPRILIDINGVNELKGYKKDQNLIIGAAVTLTELLDIFKCMAEQEYFGYLQKFYEHLKKVAHIPVRNVGTIAGNLMIKHKDNFFPSDIYLLLETVGAQLTLVYHNLNMKTVTMQEFLRSNMRGVVILNVMLPPLSDEHQIETFKIMPRSTTAHAIVNAGFFYQLSRNSTVLTSRIVFGGLSASFTRAYGTEQYLVGKKLFTNDTLQSALKILKDELVVTENPPEASVEFRRRLAVGLFYKGLLSLSPENILHTRYKSGAVKLHKTRPVSKSSQHYETDPSVYPLNQPIQKVEALIQCSGEAFYSDDLPAQPYEVFAALALTTVATGDIVSINPTKALSQPGVLAFYTAEDIPGKNSLTPTDKRFHADEEVFCKSKVKYFNQPYGVIVAETQFIAEKAAKMVEVKYMNVTKPVTDIKEAIQDSKRVTFYDSIDAADIGSDVNKVITGGNTMYSQYHFPMENIVSVIHPTQEGMKVYTSTHWTEGVQMVLSRALNIDQNCIDVYVRHVGGSFGMKITGNIQSAVACGLVVQKLNRPCRLVQSLTSTMRAVGKKLPSTTNYEVGVNSSGIIQYMNYNLYQDNGYTINLMFSFIVMNSYNNCYDKSRWKFNCYNTVTETAKNTSLRAPGVLDSVGQVELLMEQIAYELSLDPIEVRLNNLDREKYSAIEEMFNTIKTDSNYDERRLAVNNYNKENRWKKRGLRFSFLRCATEAIGILNVIISIYRGDGTVVITHGGVEMGQGINTKAIQTCAYYLKIPIEKIKVKGTDTIIAPNCMETGASMGSQNVGLGVSRCCEELLKRLEPIRNKKPGATWEEIIAAAYESNIDLQTQSFVSLEDVERYSYDMFGVSLAEVEIDVLTGETEILRVDVIEDVGKSVSPEIDVGQVEGAFIMGIGYWTSEKLVYDKNTGELLTNRTWNYSVPMNTDIPQDFRVYFRKNSSSYNAIQGAKAVGEPPMCLSINVALAIREAISQARLESRIPTTEWFNIDGPLTVEMIGLSTETKVTDFKFN